MVQDEEYVVKWIANNELEKLGLNISRCLKHDVTAVTLNL